MSPGTCTYNYVYQTKPIYTDKDQLTPSFNQHLASPSLSLPHTCSKIASLMDCKMTIRKAFANRMHFFPHEGICIYYWFWPQASTVEYFRSLRHFLVFSLQSIYAGYVVEMTSL